MNALASAGYDVSEIVQSLSVFLLIILSFRAIQWRLPGPTNKIMFYFSWRNNGKKTSIYINIQRTQICNIILTSVAFRVHDRHQSECRALFSPIQSISCLTVWRVLHGGGLYKQVAPGERHLSCPSVCVVWLPCHQQSLSRPRLLASGCGLCHHMTSGLRCMRRLCPCCCSLRTHHSSGGVVPSQASSACKRRLWTWILLQTLIN